MDVKRIETKEQEEILALAENTKSYCDLLINQCDSWLSEEEGLKNLKEKKKRKSRKKKMFFFILLLLFTTVRSIALIRDMAESKGLTLDVRMPETAVVTCDKNTAANCK